MGNPSWEIGPFQGKFGPIGVFWGPIGTKSRSGLLLLGRCLESIFRERIFVFGCLLWSYVFSVVFCLGFCLTVRCFALETDLKDSLQVRSFFF